ARRGGRRPDSLQGPVRRGWHPDLADQRPTDRRRRWLRLCRGRLRAGHAPDRAQAPPAEPVLDLVRDRLADDLDTAGAIAAVDQWAADQPGPDANRDAPALVANLVDALLGVRL